MPQTLDAFLEMLERDSVSDPAVLVRLRAALVDMLEVAHAAREDMKGVAEQSSTQGCDGEQAVAFREINMMIGRLSEALMQLDREHLS